MQCFFSNKMGPSVRWPAWTLRNLGRLVPGSCSWACRGGTLQMQEQCLPRQEPRGPVLGGSGRGTGPAAGRERVTPA